MREAIKKNIKYIINVLFIGIVGYMIYRLLFQGQEFSTIVRDLHYADKRWLLLGVVLVYLFVSGESIIINYMLRMFRHKIHFRTCLKYSFVGFFFSCITPSSSGGQPAQMYYMKKDGIKIGLSTLIMLIIAITYKAVLVVLGVFFLIFKWNLVTASMGKLCWLLWVGFVLNIGYIALLIAITIKPMWAKKVGLKLLGTLTRIKILKVKKYKKNAEKLSRICDNYMIGASYIKDNAYSVVKIFLLTVVQRVLLFAVTWVVYKSYGLSGTGFIDIIILQTMISIACEMLPLPGAAGITEGCFIVAFAGIFGKLTKPAMLLSRGLSFYVLLIMSAGVALVAHIIMLKKTKANGDTINTENFDEPDEEIPQQAE